MSCTLDQPALLNLPNEILGIVSSNVLPEDLESWAQTNKRIRTTSIVRFYELRAQMIRKYSTLMVHLTYTGPGERLLIDVLEDPHKARYITRLQAIKDLAITRRERRWFREGIEPADLELFIAAAERSEYLSNPEYDYFRKNGLLVVKPTCSSQDYWRSEAIQVSNPNSRSFLTYPSSILMAILLPLLPNLTVLELFSESIDDEYGGNRRLLEMLQRVPQARAPILTKLRFVHLTSSFSLDYVVASSALPSGVSIAAHDAGKPAVFLEQGTNSPECFYVRKLDLFDCCVSPDYIANFLSKCRHLESFAYSYNPWEDVPSSVDFPSIGSALIHHSGQKLQKLTLLSHWPKNCCIGSLRGLVGLQDLWIEWDLLLPNSATGITSDGLSQLLPGSLQILSIHDQLRHHSSCYDVLIHSLVSCKVSALPLLTAFNLSHPEPGLGLSPFHDSNVERSMRDSGIAFGYPHWGTHDNPARQGSYDAFEEMKSSMIARDDSYERWINWSGMDEPDET